MVTAFFAVIVLCVGANAWGDVDSGPGVVQYGAQDGYCSYDGFNWNGYVNLD